MYIYNSNGRLQKINGARVISSMLRIYGEKGMNGIEGTDFIKEMQPWKITGAGAPGYEGARAVQGADGSSLFKNVLRTAVENVRSSQIDVENKQYLLATGQLEDAHSLPIAEAKAQISLELLISLRNKAMEGYNELLKMNI